MQRKLQRANGSERLVPTGMLNGPGRCSLSRVSGVGADGILPPLSGSGYRTIVLYFDEPDRT